MGCAVDDLEAGLRHQVVHQVVARARAEGILGTHQDEGGAIKCGERGLLVGALGQGAGLAQECYWAEADGHVHAEVENFGLEGPLGKVVGLHLVAHHFGEASGFDPGDLWQAAGLHFGDFGEGVGVKEGEAFDPMGCLAQHLHRHDAAHRQTGEGKAGRGVLEDLGGE